jgi:serine protease inhibitor
MSLNHHPRVPGPDPDDESLREFGRQLAMDSLLMEALLERPAEIQSPPRPRWRAPALAVAASVLLSIGVTAMLWTRDPERALPDTKAIATAPRLAAGWRIIPTGDAVYRVMAPGSVRLDRGEIAVESVPGDGGADRPALTIATPDSTAKASESEFLIATYPIEPSTPKGPAMRSLTRILVLAGVVAMSNPHGAVTGQAGQLLAADSDKAPVNHAVKASGDFAFDLYKQLAKDNKGKNLFFSPYSMSTALLMTAEGARGETAEQMGKVLRFPEAARPIGAGNDLIPWKTAVLHSGMKDLHERFNPKPASQEMRQKLAELRKQHVAMQKRAEVHGMDEEEQKAEELLLARIEALNGQIDPYVLRTANALWGEQSYSFLKPYVEAVSKHYGATFHAAGFMKNAEAERLRINAWVEKETNDRIKNLLPAGSVSDVTRLVLTNAIYFKGDWLAPFDVKNTRPKAFHALGGKVTTSMMHQDDIQVARYAAVNPDGSAYPTPRKVKAEDRKPHTPAGGGAILAEIPYKGGDLAMVLVIPTGMTGLPELENKLTNETLSGWLDRLEKRTIHLQMPRFKFDSYYSMRDTLQAMGMVRAFEAPRQDGSGAQFEGMTDSTTFEDRLFISGVYHKGFVEVNEKGTEAAAATAVGMFGGGLPVEIPFIPTVRADRPFVYLIRDVKTGTILFMGRMMDPTQAN